MGNKSGPNKTVSSFKRARADHAAKHPVSAFVAWMAEQARAGVRFDTVEQARAAFAKATGGVA